MAAGPLAVVGHTVGSVRRRLAIEVTNLIMGDNPPVRDTRPPVEGDPGLFGPGSVTWMVHQDSCLLVGGVRALMLQTMHPLAMAGVDEHSNYRTDPLGRLANTALFVGTVIWGTRDQAERAVAQVKKVHERVTGVAPDGRPYAANDPHLLTWVHHTLVDSFLRAHWRYGSERLTRKQSDRYVAEMAVLCELFEAEPAARSVAELRQYFRDIRGELAATPAARDTMRFLLVPPLPLHARPPYTVLAAAAVGLLPAWVRRELWAPMPPAVEPLVVRPACWTLFRALDWVMAAYPWEHERQSASTAPAA